VLRLADAQVVTVPVTPQIGSPNPATAEPLVPRPKTKPCTVQLFQNLEFADFNAKTFSFTPPPACEGPWAKVVFTADFTVTEGRQFDRTAAFYLGHANIYYGTTAEPSKAVSPSWHIERDVTDLSAIFSAPQTGEADLGNFVGVSGGVTYNGLIYANSALEFYPASRFECPPVVPDVVVPLPDAEGGAATLNNTASQLSQSVTLPTNVERVYLDVIAQSQSNDEFWYTCVPNDVTNELASCGNTGFRETEISIDGEPAGVAPVYPWIYTGGIDPYLWRPITGVQTLDFKPYRVDLTPFAGLLADGQAHTLALSVYNADSYFLATANLLAYADHRLKKVSGGILENTLAAAPAPVVTENLKTDDSGNITGTVAVTSARAYSISGYLNTSHGKIKTTVAATLSFSNTQAFTITQADYVQAIAQTTTVDSKTTVTDGWVSQTTDTTLSYPFTLNYSQIQNADGSYAITTTSDQQDLVNQVQKSNGFEVFKSQLSEEVKSTDTLNLTSSFSITGNSNQASSASYLSNDSTGNCYGRSITAAAGVLTSLKDGAGCRCR
jgi:hypothetical protein